MSTQPFDHDGSLRLLEFVNILCRPGHHRSATDLNNLPVEERKRVFEDLAGSTPLKVEKVHELADGIREMDNELAKITTGKDAFDLAYTLNPDYVTDPIFRLMFLRGNEYNAKAAAGQLVKHFEEKLALFGEQMLGKDIKLSDLTADDLDALRSGGIQISKYKDRAGRSIVFFRYAEYRFKERINLVRKGGFL